MIAGSAVQQLMFIPQPAGRSVEAFVTPSAISLIQVFYLTRHTSTSYAYISWFNVFLISQLIPLIFFPYSDSRSTYTSLLYTTIAPTLLLPRGVTPLRMASTRACLVSSSRII